MIDWIDVITNSLWIVGCALGLVVFSYSNWEAAIRKERLRVILGYWRMQVIISLAGMLFCLGLMSNASAIWESLGWGVLALGFGIQAWLIWRGRD
ncbi:MAG: hypothetical protein ABIL11_05625 [Chloroflexota bacterium]